MHESASDQGDVSTFSRAVSMRIAAYRTNLDQAPAPEDPGLFESSSSKYGSSRSSCRLYDSQIYAG